MDSGGEGPQQGDKVCPHGPCVASPPCLCLLSPGDREPARGGTGLCVTSRPCPQLLGSVAIPQLLPWLFLHRFLVPAPTLLRTRCFPGLLLSSHPPDAVLPVQPFRIPGTGDPASPGRVYIREFCGLMACLHPARESKPSRGGRSINRANIYARANPRGAGMRPAAGAGRTPPLPGKGWACRVFQLHPDPVPSPPAPRRRAAKRLIGW